ncbi:MAG TPA: hypothetical protein DIU15_07240, partial [Deltaproteobacteria bacterium]|nr:hypothetical protein [Deltaproteobacteria bacterium]
DDTDDDDVGDGDDTGDDDDLGDDDDIGDDDTGDDDTGDDDTGDDDTGDDDSEDIDGDGFTVADGDCDDLNPGVHPDHPEICDGVDNDCDVSTNEADGTTAATWYADLDGDSYGSPTISQVACSQPVGFVLMAAETDCNDLRDDIFPGAPETCDGVDNDCNGQDDASGFDGSETDNDGDGQSECSGDCDDTDASVNSEATESCDDGEDNNCDGHVDEGPDLDGDGVAGAPCGNDCDDSASSIYLDAPELCDETDSDCDESLVDEFSDIDGDAVPDCVDPDADGDLFPDVVDCNDLDPLTHPGAPEDCTTTDRNCDGHSTNGAADGAFWYADLDADGYGGLMIFTQACSPPAGYLDSSLALDCNDLDEAINPDAVEICDGTDNDCNGLDDALGYDDSETDDDGDGQSECDGDCDDASGSNFVGATEVCDGADNDCNGFADFVDVDGNDEVDGDGDGETQCGGDCNDTDASIGLTAVEACDTIDSDCDESIVDEFDDFDSDNQPDCIDPDDDNDLDPDSTDCDDLDPSIFSGAPEVCDTVDTDCDGGADDADECDPNASCIDSGSGPECTCDSGYDGDGLDCAVLEFPNSALISIADGQQINAWAGSTGEVWTRCYQKSTDDDCSDGIDNDGDGAIDGDDTNCLGSPANESATVTDDGDAGVFHSQCDGWSPTVVVAQLSTGRLIGGYSTASWGGGGNCSYQGSSNNFLFSLTNSFKHDNIATAYPQYSCHSHGTTFGGGHDWHMNTHLEGGYCNLGHSYACRVGQYGDDECRNDFCGSHTSWTITELEVWYR